MSYKTYLRRRVAADICANSAESHAAKRRWQSSPALGAGRSTVYSAGSRFTSLTSTPTPTPSLASRSARPPNTGTNDEPGQITCHRALRVRGAQCLRQMRYPLAWSVWRAIDAFATVAQAFACLSQRSDKS